MKRSAIRHLACSPTSPYLAAALFEYTVQIWNLDILSQVGEFETILTFGGSRLALDTSGQFCVAAGWGSGIAAYRAPSGEVLWHRKDLKHVQSVTLEPSGTKIYCGRDEGALHILESHTGETIVRLPGVEEVIESLFSPQLLLVSRGRDHTVRGRKEFRVERLGFALLDGVFGEDFLCLSEARGPVRCFNSATGAELLRFLPDSGTHVIKLGYRMADGFFYGILGNFERRGVCNLLRFEARSGKCYEVCPLDNSWEIQFCRGGDLLVSGEGTLINVSDGKILGTLDFPTQEYSED